MKKHGFEVKVNDELLCRAGLEVDFYVLTCNFVSMMRVNDEQEEVSIRVGALDSVNNRHLNWAEGRLKGGDKISIEIVESPFDVPKEIVVKDSEEFLLQRKMKYFYQLKEELKDHLKE